MLNLSWRLLAKLLARPAIATWLITRAQRTPYIATGIPPHGGICGNQSTVPTLGTATPGSGSSSSSGSFREPTQP